MDWIYLASNIISFVLGFIVRHIIQKNKLSFTLPRPKTSLTYMVTIIWSATVIVSLFQPGISVDPWIHSIMGLVAGYYFKESLKEKK